MYCEGIVGVLVVYALCIHDGCVGSGCVVYAW